MARKAGFSNITADLMFGIPNQSLEDLQRDLDILRELKPENVSIYSLIWEEGTVFWSKLQKGILSEIDQDLEAEMYEKIIDFFGENGYCQYEISNFARIDDEDKDVEINEIKKFEDLRKLQKNAGRHNLKYWRNQKFIGVGMSAASYFGDNRHSNVRTFKKYYNLIDDGKLPIDENTVEIVDETESEKLKKMLGLRLIQEGIEYFEDEKVEKLIESGLLEKFFLEKVNFTDEKNKEFLYVKQKNTKNNGGFDKKIVKKTCEARIRLTKKGMLLANDVFVEFI
jgi:coproporphyrinogen dehydrogenase